ncbi:MAG: helix-turn-helix transcriptional regulator [Bacteroidales bacterium]|nr:helix-turn-helix transcriptional regulator [Bacteroidales bacterium]
MIERIQLIMKSKNIMASTFADEIGVQRSAMSHIVSGRNNPSLDFIQKVLKKYPEVNPEWLLSGKGEMNKKVLGLFDAEEIKNIQNAFDETKTSSDVELKAGNEEIKTLENIVEKSKETVKTNVNTPLKSHLRNQVRETTKSEFKKIERIIVYYSDKTFSEYKEIV